MLKHCIKISEALKGLRSVEDGREKAGEPCEAAQSGRRSSALVRCHRGTVALEFCMVAPFMLLIMFATMYLGLALNNYLILTAAAQQGAQTLSLGRNSTSPYTTTTTAINSAAASLTTAQITRIVSIGSSSCTSDSACSALLTTAGAVASVTLTYPCNLTIMGHNYGGSPCTLSSQSASVVQ